MKRGIFQNLNRIVAKLHLLLEKGCVDEAKNYLIGIKSFVNKDDLNQFINLVNFIVSEDNVYYAKRNEYLFINHIHPDVISVYIREQYEIENKENPYLKIEKYFKRTSFYFDFELIIKNIIFHTIDSKRIFRVTKEVEKNIYVVYNYKDDTTYYLCFSLEFGKDDFIEDYFTEIIEKFDDINITHTLNSANDEFQINIQGNKYPTDKLWFTVGLKLASGELQRTYSDNNNNATQTAIKLGNKSLRPYISESIGNSTISDKNIFKRKQADLDLIVNYCKENNLEICEDFISKLPHQKD